MLFYILHSRDDTAVKSVLAKLRAKSNTSIITESWSILYSQISHGRAVLLICPGL